MNACLSTAQRRAPASTRLRSSSGRCRSRFIGRCWSRSPPARSISATTRSCAAAIACRCARTSFRCPTAPAKSSKSARASCASRPATRLPAVSSSAGRPASPAPHATRSRRSAAALDGMLAEYVGAGRGRRRQIAAASVARRRRDAALCRGNRVERDVRPRQAGRRPDGAACKAPAASRSSGCNSRTRWASPPIVTSSSDEKLKRAKALGAAARHQLQDHAGMGQSRASSSTAARGVDHVLEVGGQGHAHPLVRRHPRQRKSQHHRRPERRRARTQSRTDLLQARQCSRHLRRLDGNVRSR